MGFTMPYQIASKRLSLFLFVGRTMNLFPQPDQSIHSSADCQIEQAAPICVEPMMAQRVGKVRRKRKVKNRVPEKDCDEIFNPPPWRNAEELPHRGHCCSPKFLRHPFPVGDYTFCDCPNPRDNAPHKTKIQAPGALRNHRCRRRTSRYENMVHCNVITVVSARCACRLS